MLKPHHAMLWAASFNFLAYFLFSLTVAATIGKGTIDPAIVDHVVVFGALMVAVAWICRPMSQRKVDRTFRRLQLLSAASLGHGGNDAQKPLASSGCC